MNEQGDPVVQVFREWAEQAAGRQTVLDAACDALFCQIRIVVEERLALFAERLAESDPLQVADGANRDKNDECDS